MIKTKIVIASTLKPVDDVRAYWKFAQSMVKTNKGKYDVNIIGNKGKKESGDKDIHFYSHTLVRNQFLSRLLLPFKILKKAYSLNPDILIVTTHELLFAAFSLRLIRGCKVIYDVQENYALNAEMNDSGFGKISPFLILIKEKILALFVHHFLLAEACYKDQLAFIGDRFTVIENKAFERLELRSPQH